MAQEMQRFFEQAKVQMEEFKRSETRLLEENQQLKIAMSRLDGAHKEIKHVNASITDENKRLKDDLDMSHQTQAATWANAQLSVERTKLRSDADVAEIQRLQQSNIMATQAATQSAAAAATAVAFPPRYVYGASPYTPGTGYLQL